MKKGEKICCSIIAILVVALIILAVSIFIESHKLHPAGPIAFNDDGDPIAMDEHQNVLILNADGSHRKWLKLKYDHFFNPMDMVCSNMWKLYLLDNQIILGFNYIIRNKELLIQGQYTDEFGWREEPYVAKGGMKRGGDFLFVVSVKRPRVEIYRFSGSQIDGEKVIFVDTEGDPLSLDVSSKGDLYVLTQQYSPDNHLTYQIEKFVWDERLFSYEYGGQWGVKHYGLEYSHIAIDKLRDWLYIAYDNGDIHKFSLNEPLSGSMLDFEKGHSMLNLVTNEHGYLFAVYRDRVIEIDPSGKVVTQWK
ncbi:MAG: hypothetical protein PHW01_03040 [Patescibacteria group bacterium]|nr:hypothetical protein [Patescibacteria group bacterium]